MAEYTTLEMIDMLFDQFHPDGPEVAFMSRLRERVKLGNIPSATDMRNLHRLQEMLNPPGCEHLDTRGKCKYDEKIGLCKHIDAWHECGYYLPEQAEEFKRNELNQGWFDD